jgi:4'-phosphopantetheinyl transferase
MKRSITTWRPRPKNLILKDNEVHVWRSSLVLNSKILHRLSLTLSADELERANSFHFQKDQCSFIAGRGVLRSILANYLQTRPKEIGFTYNTRGKPSIDNVPSRSEINFNLSHSHGLALYAFTIRREIGIDIERLRSNLSFERIAKRFFTTEESDTLNTLADDEIMEEFFKLWTHKEAYIKAKGKGLSIPLNRVAVTINRDQTVRIKEIKINPDKERSWSFHSFAPAPGYVGALAVEGKDITIRFWMWSD